jgi:hypothetical protein
MFGKYTKFDGIDFEFKLLFRYNAAKDLLLSRFCSSIYSRYNITGIKIHRITRLFNRPKKLQFDHSLDFILEEEEDSMK